MKLFISYSHLDEDYINKFIKHITPLKTKGYLKEWYDRKILHGTEFIEKIDENIENSNIICLFLSSNFLSSQACINEKNRALELKKEKNINVIPIIVSKCAWLDFEKLSKLLALPTDGSPISSYTNQDEAFFDIYNGIKNIIEHEKYIKNLKNTKNISIFLNSTELLTKAHSKKDDVFLKDIYIYPELSKFDSLKDFEKKISSKNISKNLLDNYKILIAGENQSGKTSLCKMLFNELREMNLLPVYIYDKSYKFFGKIDNKINLTLIDQYENIDLNKIDRTRIVPIVDDFHLAKNKDEYINELAYYKYQILIVDDIFSLNFKDDKLIKSYSHYRIEEFNPYLRNKLITKWLQLSEKTTDNVVQENLIYKNIDEKTELVNVTLGKIFGSGIMPAYPFFILSVISSYDTFSKPLDQDITSQGYCYQALIYMYLRKEGVSNDDIDTYFNFITEFAYYLYRTKQVGVSIESFGDFMSMYLKKYNLPVSDEIIVDKLSKSKIIMIDSLGNYNFCYQYIYYFFVAKYISDHIEVSKSIIDTIIRNLHNEENAYIAIFISHHSKNNYLLDEIIVNALCLFDKYNPASLSDCEISFFDKQADVIINAALPHPTSTSEIERNKLLEDQRVEEENHKVKDDIDQELKNNELAVELRRSIKTVEVMGCFIKNRAGSLEKTVLESIFEQAMDVHLKILSCFFDLIKDEKDQKEVTDFISSKLDEYIKEENEKRKLENKNLREFGKDKLEKLSKAIFWNTNFFLVSGIINKIIHSLGSNKLTKIVEKVCDERDTPASFLVKHGIFMWYNKNLQIDNIYSKIETDGFSHTAKKIMNFLIARHCSLHKIDFKDRQKIENKFKLPTKILVQSRMNQ